MFTGLIEAMGRIKARKALPEGLELTIEHSLSEDPALGASVAVNGVCLTVTGGTVGVFKAECYYETVRKTTLNRLKPEAKVNLEQALRADGRLDGHIVQGHVSAVVPVIRTVSRGKGVELTVGLPSSGRDGLIQEGSVALDGVSLTIASLTARSLSVQLIGETLERTTLKNLRPGDLVNLERDVLLRDRESREIHKSNITMGRLAQWGYL
ncbi:MAG: riboflavin synthase [Spirochaetales bacterium]|nr:riboflavin synthase [Spirochaetales bacterium]